ncbi:MAG: hypothetical protein IKA71_03890 [Lentisphaeria bacterium]|nr:hypothetical protein [Lentisphaeria bacterium]
MKPKIAYLGLSLELYLQTSTAETLQIWGEAFNRWSRNVAQFADISYQKLCFTDADVAEAVAAIKKTDVDAVMLSAVSYTPSMLICDALAELQLPVLIFNTQDSAIISENYVPNDLTLNHTVQGIHDITNVLYRRKFPFSIVSGHDSDPEVMAALEKNLRAIRAAKAAKNIRVLALGGFFKGMGDFEFDPEAMKNNWGPEFVAVEGKEFLEVLATVDDDEAEAIRLGDMEKFEILPGLEKETHLESIRRYLAVKKMLKQYNCNAFTMNFTNLLKDFGQLPFYAINCLMAEGIGYAGEGDILRAAAMRQFAELCGTANFSEIYTVDFKRDLFFMSHMQECNIAIARRDRKVQLKQMPFWVNGVPDYAGMFFTAAPGDYTLVCLTPTPDNHFRLVAFEGNVPDLPVLYTYNRAYWLFRPDRPVKDTLDDYSLQGGAHHLSAVAGRKCDELKMLADQLGFEFVRI